MDIMSSAPNDAKCHQFADYMLENYMSSDARYPPQLWADIPREGSKPTTNDRNHSTHTSSSNVVFKQTIS
jgi:hypothetical protein